MIAALAAAGAFALQQGDRVVFYGDSITEHQRYSASIEAFVRTRMPGLKVSFMGAGWAGDTAKGGSQYWEDSGGEVEERVRKDVAPRGATFITVMLGMNDAYYSPFNQEWLDGFLKDYRRLLGLLRQAAPGARFSLFSPSPWDDITRPPSFPAGVKGEGGYNATLVRYGQAIRAEVEAEKMGFVDVNGGMVEALRRASAANPELSQKLISDWIHPDWSGSLVMAAVVLEGWGAPGDVTHVKVDLAAKKGEASGAQIRKVAPLGWSQRDEGLPFPYDPSDPVMALAAASARIPEKLDRQTLTIRGLPPGQWKVNVDGEEVMTASHEELAQGVSLAHRLTPMRKRSLEALRLVKVKNRLQQARWREVERQALGRFSQAEPAVKALIKLEEDVVKQIQAVAKPRWSSWTLEKAP